MPRQDRITQLEAYKCKHRPHEDRTEFMVEVEYEAMCIAGLL